MRLRRDLQIHSGAPPTNGDYLFPAATTCPRPAIWRKPGHARRPRRPCGPLPDRAPAGRELPTGPDARRRVPPAPVRSLPANPTPGLIYQDPGHRSFSFPPPYRGLIPANGEAAAHPPAKSLAHGNRHESFSARFHDQPTPFPGADRPAIQRGTGCGRTLGLLRPARRHRAPVLEICEDELRRSPIPRLMFKSVAKAFIFRGGRGHPGLRGPARPLAKGTSLQIVILSSPPIRNAFSTEKNGPHQASP